MTYLRTMASNALTNKALLDIEDCISELKRYKSTLEIAVNDDNSVLHRLEEKLEFILQLGLKEKPGVFGTKRSYWDYIATCFSSSKRLHQGISHVKSNSEIKSSLGRGRALIRLCLIQKSLADTLQNCFIDKKTTRDFYLEPCLPLQPKLWPSFVTFLYDLNEIHFDLNPLSAELDVSWPSFARKLFPPPEKEVSFGRNLTSSTFSSEETQHLVEVNSVLEADVQYLQKKCESLVKEICAVHQSEEIVVETPKETIEKVQQDPEIFTPQVVNDFKLIGSNEFCDENSINNIDNCSKHINTELNFMSELNSNSVCDLKTNISYKKNLECVEDTLSLKSCFSLGSADTFPKEMNEISCQSDHLKLLNISNEPTNLTSVTLSQQDSGLGVFTSEEKAVCNINSLDINNISIASNLHLGEECSIYEIETSSFYKEISGSMSRFFIEMKALLNNITNNIQTYGEEPQHLSHLTDLKNLWSSVETILFSEINKLKEFQIQKCNLEEFTCCVKHFALKQDSLIDNLLERINTSVKENEDLYDKMCFLKDKLHSYGLLKIQTESDLNYSKNSSPTNKSLLCLDNIKEEPDCAIVSCKCMSNDYSESLDILKNSYSKLTFLNIQSLALQTLSDSSHKLNNNLLCRVQDQEMHMKGITKELEEAHHLLSVMRKQHQKLQSAENIIKYNLQEKRKLLTRLKEQLETTREDCNLVRMKNSKSEVEWQSLRKEFVQRHKQTSEESGFVDDKGLEDQTSTILNSIHETDLISNNLNTVAIPADCTIDSETKSNKTRLEMLEEQCQILCTNLLHSSKKREEIDCRLETWCKAIEKSHPEGSIQTEKLTEIYTIDKLFNNEEEVVSEKIGCDSNSDANNSLCSSDIGSLNSDCCSCLPLNSTEVLTDVSCSLDSFKTDLPKLGNLQFCENKSLPYDIHLLAIESVPIGNQIISSIDSKSIENMPDTSYSGSIESLEETEDCPSRSHASPEKDSVISKESCPDECLRLAEIQEEFYSQGKSKCAVSGKVPILVYELQEKNRILQTRLQELERENGIISQELDKKIQQLQLLETDKEQEITALQFQLNSQVLMHERALKEFSDHNDGLKNMKQKVNDQEQLILSLEEALAEIQVERESEKELQWEQLEDFKKYSLRDREVMEAEIIHLQNDSKHLKKKVIKLLKEKDILWKRNDHLTFLQKIQFDDRWVADHEVSDCLGCRNHFSFLLRKHHCRLCGRIFCNSCSNNWLLTPSSRKQIRACNECYMQHMEIKKVVRRDSNVQYIEDDSGDELVVDNLSIGLNRCTSLNSEMQSSMADSIVSLPAVQMDNPRQMNHFTSAPDLRFVLQNCEISSDLSSSNHCQIKYIGSTVSGDLPIEAGEKSILPIITEINSTDFQWSITPTFEAIPVSLIYEDASRNGIQQIVVHQSSCETEGVMHLTRPGLYKFHVDNISRLTSTVVHYDLKTKTGNEQTCS